MVAVLPVEAEAVVAEILDASCLDIPVVQTVVAVAEDEVVEPYPCAVVVEVASVAEGVWAY